MRAREQAVSLFWEELMASQPSASHYPGIHGSVMGSPALQAQAAYSASSWGKSCEKRQLSDQHSGCLGWWRCSQLPLLPGRSPLLTPSPSRELLPLCLSLPLSFLFLFGIKGWLGGQTYNPRVRASSQKPSSLNSWTY